MVAAVVAAVIAAGCGASRPPEVPRASSAAAAIAIDLARTRPLGAGLAFRPAAVGNPAVVDAAPIGALRCTRAVGPFYGAHIELFARDRGIAVPAGIGIAPPQRRHGPVITGGRCAYPLRTTDPTGVVKVAPRGLSGVPTVGQLFEIWGEPLSTRRLGGFRAVGGGGVVAFLDGRRWRGDPRAVPLHRHAQIELELNASVAPHPAYTFPPGL